MDCEICGRPAKGKARIEGTVVSVCGSCSAFGESIFESSPVKLPDRPRQAAPEEVFFVPDFPAKIKSERERKSLSKEQLASAIKERASVIDRIEKGMRPERRVAEKLEKFLGIRLMRSIDAEKTVSKGGHAEDLTLGDIAVVKKRKK
jgi:uncharacterized protein (TIGR00270 family)